MDGEVSGHELCRVVCFEIARLVSYPRVASRVRFVESIGSKFLPVFPDLIQGIGVVTVTLTAFHEFILEACQHRHLFLTHRLTEFITLTSGEVSQQSAQQHDLLLIDRDTVGVLEVFLHHRDIVGHGFKPLFTLDELRDIIHWSGSVEGIHGDEVTNDGRFQFTQVFLHTGGLELEDSHRAAFLEELIGQLIVNRYMVDVDINAACFLDVTQTFFDDRQGNQTEEVHLDQPHTFYHMSVVFGHEYAFLAVLIFDGTQGREVGQVVCADDDATGMYAHLADRTFEACRVLEHRLGVGVAKLIFVR